MTGVRTYGDCISLRLTFPQRLAHDRTNKCGKDSDITTCPQHYMVGSPVNMNIETSV